MATITTDDQLATEIGKQAVGQGNVPKVETVTQTETTGTIQPTQGTLLATAPLAPTALADTSHYSYSNNT